MNLHEYQAKSLFAEFNIPIPKGTFISSPNEAVAASKKIGGSAWIMKAQIHAGARGKAGGVKQVKTEQEIETVAHALLGKSLSTPQTHGRELPINRLLIEQTLEIQRELYLSALIDRSSESITFITSTEGGMDIEAVATDTPHKIMTTYVNTSAGLQPYQCRQVAFSLGLNGSQIKSLSQIMLGLYRLFTEKDLALVEINPLIVTAENELVALDAKLNIDDNALYRRPDLLAMRDPSQEDKKENEAAKHQLNYISLDGNIGCMVNGAGLAMATMDLIKLEGGEPANFLDVGGGTTAARVAEAFKLILSEARVKAILVNIFGGIVQCNLIAEGIIQAFKEVGVNIPVIVRLEGTNAEQGLDILKQSGLNIKAISDLSEAARTVVASINS